MRTAADLFQGLSHKNAKLRERDSLFSKNRLAQPIFKGNRKIQYLLAVVFVALAGASAWAGLSSSGSTANSSSVNGPPTHHVEQLESKELRSDSDTDVKVKVKSNTHSSNSSSTSSTTVNVNGREIHTSSGSVEEHIVSDDGNTTVDITVQNNSQAEGEDM